MRQSLQERSRNRSCTGIVLCALSSLWIACSATDLETRTPASPPSGPTSAQPKPALVPAPPRQATQELLERLAPALSRSSTGLTWTDAGGGVRSMDLRGRFQHATLAVLGEDGVVRSTCVETLEAADAVLHAADGIAP